MLAASTSTTTAEIQYLDHMTDVKMQIRVESENRVRRGWGEERVRRDEERVRGGGEVRRVRGEERRVRRGEEGEAR